MPADRSTTHDRPRVRDRVERAIGRLLLRLPARALIALAGSEPLVVDGAQLDPGVHFLRVMHARRVRHGLTEPTIDAGRARYRRDARAFAGPRTRVGSVRALTAAGADGPLGARLYRPRGATGDMPLLVYFHGGGFVIGDIETHDEPCRVLCRYARTSVLSVAYRLAPEHPFPAAVDDALAAWRWARAHAATLGADPSRITIGGDSAGGNLAAVVSLLTAFAEEAPAAQLLVYPAVDPLTARRSRELFGAGLFLTMRDVEAFEHAYRGGQPGEANDPRVAPLFARDLRGLPPALVITAGFDVLRDEGEAYAHKLDAAGVDVVGTRYEGMIHDFGLLNALSDVPAVRAALHQASEDLRQKLQ